jgi:rhodanese-related sulfurtransferase
LFPEGKKVYLHCKSGIRCLKAANLLEKQGIKTEAIKAPFDDLKKAFAN